MNENIAMLNVVIAQLTLVTAELAAGARSADLAGMLDSATAGLALARSRILVGAPVGQSPVGGGDN